MIALRTAAAWVLCTALAAGFGVATALAGRIIHLAGLYETAAALTLGALAVTICHALALGPRRVAILLAGSVACAWLAAHETTDAWATWADQARWLREQPMTLAQDLAVAEVDQPAQLIDLGLRAETGRAGLVGAWLMQNKRGPVVARTLGVQRALPGGLFLVALALAVRGTLVGWGAWRALRRLALEPRCPRCGRYLRRSEIGRVGEAEMQCLAQAWSAGLAQTPDTRDDRGPYRIFSDDCPRGHLARPGLCAVRLRRRGWSEASPGTVAELPPELAA